MIRARVDGAPVMVCRYRLPDVPPLRGRRMLCYVAGARQARVWKEPERTGAPWTIVLMNGLAPGLPWTVAAFVSGEVSLCYHFALFRSAVTVARAHVRLPVMRYEHGAW